MHGLVALEVLGVVAHKGSGGGGGSSGKVSWPGYLMDAQMRMLARGFHQYALDWDGDTSGNTVATTDLSVFGAMRSAWYNSPYAVLAAFDPSANILDAEAELSVLQALITALSPTTDVTTAHTDGLAAATTILPTTVIAPITALDAEITEANTELSDTMSDEVADLNNSLIFAQQELSDLSVATTFQQHTQMAADEFDASVMPDAGVNALVEAFEQGQQVQLRRSIARLTGGLADINAVNSSAFAFGTALLEYEHLQTVARYRAELELQNSRAKVEFVSRAVAAMQDSDLKKQQMQQELVTLRQNQTKLQHMFLQMRQGVIQIRQAASQAYVTVSLERARMASAAAQLIITALQHQVQAESVVVQARSELSRMAIVAQKEQVDTEIDMTVKNYLWKLDLFQYGANMLAGIQGGTGASPSMQRSATPMSQIGGAVTGAVSGMMAGPAIGAGAGALMGTAAMPVVGTAIGALLGGLGGFMSN